MVLTSLLPLWFEVFAMVVVMLTEELFIEALKTEDDVGLGEEQLGICRESCLESSLDCRTFWTSLILPPLGTTWNWNVKGQIFVKYQLHIYSFVTVIKTVDIFITIITYTGCPVRVLGSLNWKDGDLYVMWITLLRTLTGHPVHLSVLKGLSHST